MDFSKNEKLFVKIAAGVLLVLLFIFVWQCNDDSKELSKKVTEPAFYSQDFSCDLEKGIITNKEIKGAIKGRAKKGWYIQKIQLHNPRLAGVLKKNNTLNIQLKDIGIFTARITMARQNFPSQAFTGVFIINSQDAPKLSFKKLVTSKRKISNKKLLLRVRGEKQGYAVKMLFAKNKNVVVQKNRLWFKRTGSFRVKIVLAKKGSRDVIVRNARIRIIPKPPSMQFKKLITPEKRVSFSQILFQIKGLKKGYLIEKIEIKDDGIIVNPKDIVFKNVGEFSLKITLAKPGAKEIVLKNAEVKILPSKAPILDFDTLISSKKNITYAAIFDRIIGEKQGYTIAKITCPQPALAIFKDSLLFKQLGKFSLHILLKKQNFQDVIIEQAQVSIVKQSAPNLVFPAFRKDISINKKITSQEIFGQIQGTKQGYTIKNIEILQQKWGGVTLSGKAPDKIIQIEKVGNFQAKITLQKENFEDVVIKDAKFIVPFDLSFGGKGNDEFNTICKVAGGYVAAGTTQGKNGYSDGFIVKLNEFGQVLWKKSIQGSAQDVVSNIIYTKDNHMIMGGWTSSRGKGEYDLWVKKLNQDGETVWEKTFGGKDYDRLYSLIETKDAGICLAGYTISKGAGESDIWLVKIDKQGNLLWDKTVGGKENEIAFSLVETADKNFVVASITEGKGNGAYDAYIFKVSPAGQILWEKTFGQKGWDKASQVIATRDGGVAVSGFSKSKRNMPNFWIVKLDSTGRTLWKKNFGGKQDEANGLVETKNGNLIVVGSTKTSAAGFDGYVIKLDNKGNLLWQKTFGGKKDDHIKSTVRQTDGKYLLAGSTQSKGRGGKDAWILLIDSDGNLQ